MQSALISFRLAPLRTVAPLRVRANVCLPVPISTAQALAPACALNVFLLLPEETWTWPGSVRSATTKTESATSSAPLGRPWKKFPAASLAGAMVLSVELQLADFSAGRYQYIIWSFLIWSVTDFEPALYAAMYGLAISSQPS